MRTISYSFIILLALLLAFSISSEAQGKKKRKKRSQVTDTLQAVREFMTVCNGYKQLPLQAEVTLRNSSNLVTRTMDTASFDGFFYLQESGSYMRFGETEQLSNDSLVLVVSDKARRMLLYDNTSRVADQLQWVTGLQLQDSSLQFMAERYSAARFSGKEAPDTIRLQSRVLLPGLSLPMEVIETVYNEKTKQPVRVSTLKRSLLMLTPTEYRQRLAHPEENITVMELPGKGFFLVKEQRAVFDFKKITHEKDIRIPVTLPDRISGTAAGYVPVKGYQEYRLMRN